MTQYAGIALALFLTAYAVIVSEKIHRTKVALVGAVFVILFKVMSQSQALEKIDFNTLGLLIGMMIIVAITSKTGLFQYIAVKSAKMVKGEPLKIMVVFFWLTAAGSALLDNVTTVLLFTSVVFAICDILQINPVPFLVIEILAANIGGTATLIGDPPNIMIGSATGLGFNDFILNLGVPVFFICIFTCWPLCWIYRKEMQVTPQQKERMMILDEASFLTDVPLMKTAFPRMILSVIISNIYIYFAYLL